MASVSPTVVSRRGSVWLWAGLAAGIVLLASGGLFYYRWHGTRGTATTSVSSVVATPQTGESTPAPPPNPSGQNPNETPVESSADTTVSKVATNNKMLQGSWYCPNQGSYQRFDFDADGTFMWFSYLLTQDNRHLWSPDFTTPWHYVFRSSSRIEIDKNNRLLIESLTPDNLRFKWFAYGKVTSFGCVRTRPSGDTDISRAAAAKALNEQKKAFMGKWTSLDETEYVEFLANDVCVYGYRRAGSWVVSRAKYLVYHEGKDVECGDRCIYSRESSDKLVYDCGMGGEPTTFVRTKPQSK